MEWRRHPVIQWGQPICVVRYIGCPYCNIRSNICMCYKGVSRKLSGRYQCRASNLEGDSASNYIHLDIKCKNNVLAVQGSQDKLQMGVGQNLNFSKGQNKLIFAYQIISHGYIKPNRIMLTTGCSLNIVFFSKNSLKFATSPSPALGCYWLY